MRKRTATPGPFKTMFTALLAIALVTGLFPLVGAAEESSERPTENVQNADALELPDAAIPEDASTFESQTRLEGDEEDPEGEEAGDPADASEEAASTEAPTTEPKSEGTPEAAGEAAQASPVQAGPNPFKAGVDAQPLLDHENYDKRTMVDEDGNVDETEKAKRWKTSAGCAGTKMWAGTLIQDDGYWDQPGWWFECGWSAPDPLHAAEAYGRVESSYGGTVDGSVRDVVVMEGDAGLTALDLSAVFDGGYDVYAEYGAFKYHRLRSLSVPGFVKSLGEYSFQQDGTNAFLTQLTFEEGVERIASNAFSSCQGLAEQDMIALPASLRYLEGSAFSYCGALTVRLDNPDVRFAGADEGTESIGAPFDDGTTIYACKHRSDGSDSDPYLLSQREGGPAYTYIWLDEDANAVDVHGRIEVPEGGSVSDVTVILEQGSASREAAVGEDGTFSFPDARPAQDAVLRVQLPGCYDRVFSRAASLMNAGDEWDLGTISADAFEKIPAKRAFPLSVLRKTSVGEEGDGQLAAVTDDSKLTYKLHRDRTELTAGTDADYVIQQGQVILSEALAADETALAQLTLEVSPDPSLKLAAATAPFDEGFGGFKVVLPTWGRALVTTEAPNACASQVLVFEGAASSARCILRDQTSVRWPEGAQDPQWFLQTGQLPAGTYTVAALKPVDGTLNASHLSSLENAGIPFAKAVIQIEDDQVTEATLAVPDFNAEDVLASMGVKSIRVKGPSGSVVAGCETVLEVSYELERPADMKLSFDAAADGRTAESAALKSEGAVTLSTEADRMTAQIPAGNAEDALYVSLVPTEEKLYSVPVSATIGGTTVHVGDASFIALGVTVDVPGGCVSQTGNKATVHAAPRSEVEISIQGQTVTRATTNALGNGSAAFDVPQSCAESLLYGDRVKVQARCGASESFTNCTWRPAAQIASFKITNAGTTQIRVEGGQEQPGWLTMTHQIPQRKNAYWTFDVTVDAGSQEINAGRELMMYATLADGDTVAVPLLRKSQTAVNTRYVGEYVDEAYLALLEEYPDETLFGTALLHERGLFIPESYSFSGFSLAYQANLDDEDYLKRLSERAEQEAKDRQAQYLELWNQCWSGFDNGTAEGIASETDQLLQATVDALKARDDSESEKVRNAISQIEALRPDFQNVSEALLAPTDDDWIASIDEPFFTGEFPAVDMPSAPSSDEVAAWMEGSGADADEIAAIRDKLQELTRAMDACKLETAQEQRELSRAADKLGEKLGCGKPSEAGSPYALLDDNLVKQGNGSLKVSDGDAAAGAKESEMAEGRFTGEVFATETQKNGSEGETPGIYAGCSFKVTETPPAGASSAEAKVGTYTVNFSENHEHHDGAVIDTLWGAGLDLLGLGLEKGGKPASEFFANEMYRNFMNPLFKKINPTCLNKLIDYVNAYSNLSLQRIQTETFASAASVATQVEAGISTLGLLGNKVGMDRTTASWRQSSDELAMIESDIEQINAWILYYKKMNPCDSDCTRCLDALFAERDAAEKYREYCKAEDDHNWFDIKMNIGSTFANAVITVASLGSGGMAGGVATQAGTAGNVISKFTLVVDVLSMEQHLKRAPWMDVAQNEYEEATAYRESVCKSTKKKKQEEAKTDEEKEQDRLRGTIDWDRFYGANVILDPSGFAYEAVESNVIEGAVATVYRADNALGLGASAWDADAYEQANPQVTGADGAFQWNVPTGWYKVKVEKEGYAPAETDWLSVLPIQTSHKLALMSTETPEVAAVRAQPDVIEMEFSQFMRVDAPLEIGGVEVREAVWEETENAPDGANLSTRLLIYPEAALEEGSALELSLKGAESYTGAPLGGMSGWRQEAVVEKLPATMTANYEYAICLQAGQSAPVAVRVRYADGTPVANQAVTAQVGAKDIASLDAGGAASTAASATTDADGNATFVLSGDLPGFTELSLAAEGTSLAKVLDVRTTTDVGQPARPVAKIADEEFNSLSPKENAATVTAGSLLYLSTPTEGAAIYYTTDDTCPCNAAGTRKLYTAPLPVNADTRFRIAAYKEGLPFDEYSERLNVTVKTTGTGTSGEEPGQSEGTGEGAGSPEPGAQPGEGIPSGSLGQRGLRTDGAAELGQETAVETASLAGMDLGDGLSMKEGDALRAHATRSAAIPATVVDQGGEDKEVGLPVIPLAVLVLLCAGGLFAVVFRREQGRRMES